MKRKRIVIVVLAIMVIVASAAIGFFAFLDEVAKQEMAPRPEAEVTPPSP